MTLDNKEEFHDITPPKATPEELTEEESLGQPPLRLPGKLGKPKFNIPSGIGMTILVSLIVSFLVITLIGAFGGGSFVTKKDFNNNWSGMVSSWDATRLEIQNTKQIIDNAIQGIPNTVSTQVNNTLNQSLNQIHSQLSSLVNDIDALQTNNQYNADRISNLTTQLSNIDITALKQSVDNLKNQVANLDSVIADYDITLTDLSTRLEDIEELLSPSSGSTSPQDVVTVNVKALSDSLIPSVDKKSVTAQLKLTLTNTTAVNVDDVIIAMMFQTEMLPITVDTVVTLSSSPVLNWLSSGWFNFMTEYRNSWGLTVEANKIKTIYVTLTISDPSEVFLRPYGYQVDVTIE